MERLVLKLWGDKYKVSEIAWFTGLSCKDVVEIITNKRVIDYINESYM